MLKFSPSVHVRSVSPSTILVRNMPCFPHQILTWPSHVPSAPTSLAPMAGPLVWDVTSCKRITLTAFRMRLARKLLHLLPIPTTRHRPLAQPALTTPCASVWIVTETESINSMTTTLIARGSCLVQDPTNTLRLSAPWWCRQHSIPLSSLRSRRPKIGSDRLPCPRFNHRPTSTRRRPTSCSTSNRTTRESQWPSLAWTKLTYLTLGGARRLQRRLQVPVPTVDGLTSPRMSSEFDTPIIYCGWDSSHTSHMTQSYFLKFRLSSSRVVSWCTVN